MNLSVVGLTKFVVSGLVGVGTGKIVSQLIKSTITPETVLDKVTVTAAAWVIGAIATETTKKYSDEMVDSVSEVITTVVNRVKTGLKLGRINRGEKTFEEEGLDPESFKQDEKHRWVIKDKDDLPTIDTSTVAGMIRSGDWTYDTGKDVWVNKNVTDKSFQSRVSSDGKIEWVWGKIVL